MPLSTEPALKALCHAWYNSLQPVVITYNYINPAELQDWIFSTLQKLLTPEPSYVDLEDLQFVDYRETC